MKKITDREELTQYYGKINQYIDEYIKSHKVTPTEIYRYISKNMNRFLEKYQIGDIENIDRIVKDVLEHRKNMERDKVYKFEQFNVDLNESYISVEPSSIEHEKILADYFNTSVGHVNTLDKKNHLFEVKSFDEYFKVICFSENEISKIKSEVLDLYRLWYYNKGIGDYDTIEVDREGPLLNFLNNISLLNSNVNEYIDECLYKLLIMILSLSIGVSSS
jgi:hypothetical protein